jgi:hypothetical protein
MIKFSNNADDDDADESRVSNHGISVPPNTFKLMLTISEIAMRKIFTEDEVNLDSLQAHFLDSGFTIENPKNPVLEYVA